MSRIEVPKVVQFVALGAPAGNISVPKIAMFAILTPGDDGSIETPTRQVHVYSQKIRRG